MYVVLLQRIWISSDERRIFCRLYDEVWRAEMGLAAAAEERLPDAGNRLSCGRMVVYPERNPV